MELFLHQLTGWPDGAILTPINWLARWSYSYTNKLVGQMELFLHQ